MPVGTADAHPTRFDGPPRVVALGYQLHNGHLIGPRDMFADPSFDNARQVANDVFDYFRRMGPFEPHRLPLEEMEYTTCPPSPTASQTDGNKSRRRRRRRRRLSRTGTARLRAQAA
jgi:fructose 1,6-bisphosphatase